MLVPNLNPKDISFDDVARNSLLTGVRKLAKAVKATLGPVGKNVIIKRTNSSPLITKDGVTVAKEVVLEDRFENLGAELVRLVASKTAEVAGDGTTTATVLAEALLEAGAKQLVVGGNPASLKKGIDLAVSVVEKELANIATPINSAEQMAQVATISANGDSVIGELIAKVISKVGGDGVVTIEESTSEETKYETVEGLQFDRGYINHYFITNPDTSEAVWENPKILVYDGRLSAVKDIAIGNGKGFLDRIAAAQVPIVIIADDIDGDALTTVVLNRSKGFQVLAIRAPAFGDQRKEMLLDIATVTGTKVFSKHDKLNETDLALLGTAKKLVSSKEKTLIIGGGGSQEDVKKRIQAINHRLSEVRTERERVELKERVAKLDNGIAVIKVGGTSELEMKEKRDRVEDALYATQAAVKEGVVPGGGVALVRCIPAVKKLVKELSGDEANGAKILENVLSAPLKQIAENANQSGLAIFEKVVYESKDFGYNARTAKFENLLTTGVIDPTKVVKSAIKNAASIAGLMLTTNVVLIEREKSESQQFDK